MKKISALFLIFLILGAVLYGAGWGYLYGRGTAKIDEIYDEKAPQAGVEFLGSKPVLTGFPGAPAVIYAGGLRAGPLFLTFPEFRLLGFPLPGMPVTADFPEGLAGAGIVNSHVWALDSLALTARYPESLPPDITEENWRIWRDNGGQIIIKDLRLSRGALKAEGTGILSLDRDMQPILDMDLHVTGYQDFISGLIRDKTIKPVTGLAAIAAMNAMTDPGKQTSTDAEKRAARVRLTLRNRMLSVGPLPMVRLPEIRWDTHNLPVQPPQ